MCVCVCVVPIMCLPGSSSWFVIFMVPLLTDGHVCASAQGVLLEVITMMVLVMKVIMVCVTVVFQLLM